MLCVLRLRYVCLAAGLKNQRVRDTHAYNAVRFSYNSVSTTGASAAGAAGDGFVSADSIKAQMMNRNEK